MPAYLDRLLSACTQFLNTLLGGNQDQPFSSRAWEARITYRWWGASAVILIDTLFWLLTGEEDHCLNAYMGDTERTYVS